MASADLQLMGWDSLPRIPFDEQVAALHYAIVKFSCGTVEHLHHYAGAGLLRSFASLRKYPYTTVGEQVLAENVILFHHLSDRFFFDRLSKKLRNLLMDKLQEFASEDLPGTARTYLLQNYDQLITDYAEYPEIIADTEAMKSSAIWHFGARVSSLTGKYATPQAYICCADAFIVLNLPGFCAHVTVRK